MSITSCCWNCHRALGEPHSVDCRYFGEKTGLVLREDCSYQFTPGGPDPNLRLPGGVDYTPDPTNPKDMIGATKLPLGLIPDTVDVYAAMAFAEGASKYGAFNWRAAGVRFSIYLEALRRHCIRLSNGEWEDPKTRVPHLASIIACAGIIADAKLCGNLIDDRPPSVDMNPLIEVSEEVTKHVRTINADKTPHHWTIGDNLKT